MTADRLARLQGLLERVQSRARAFHVHASAQASEGARAAAAAAPAPPPSEPPAAVAAESPPAVPPPAGAAAPHASSLHDDGIDLPTWPPPPVPESPLVVLAPNEPEISIDVDISEPGLSLEIDVVVADGTTESAPVEESPPPASASESAERLVAARHAPGGRAPGERLQSSAPPPDAGEPIEAAEAAEVHGILPAIEHAAEAESELETVETTLPLGESPAVTGDGADAAASAQSDGSGAPQSSRRPVLPVAEAALSDIAFGVSESGPPRHTPPPESGRLPAAPVDEPDRELTGVRSAPTQAQRAAAAEAMDDPSDPPRDVVPEVLHAVLPAFAAPTLKGAARSFSQWTFAEWLEATLDL